MFDRKNTSLALELVTFSHTLFILPIIFAGYLISLKDFSIYIFLLILVAAVSARTIGMILNRIIDSDLDSRNPRTANRAIPAGKISRRFITSFLILSLIAFAVSSWLICDLVLLLSPIPLIFFFVYPYLKRVTYFCHFFLGITLSLGPLAGGIAASCSLDSIPSILPIVFFTVFWISGFDILYALQDFDSDIRNGIYSIPSYFGKKIAIIVSTICFSISSLSIFYYVYVNESSLLNYSLFIILVVGFCIQIIRSREDDFSFFKYNSYVGFLILILIISDILLR
ncbi:MAG: 4-hydroxybenzoate octaprenyltransferase [Thermodesulfobacteriota bacterium]|nr:4-hydroxybenzoate octaprenyltransferase [Thermodesulfobacteriota bacterium]